MFRSLDLTLNRVSRFQACPDFESPTMDALVRRFADTHEADRRTNDEQNSILTVGETLSIGRNGHQQNGSTFKARRSPFGSFFIQSQDFVNRGNRWLRNCAYLGVARASSGSGPVLSNVWSP